MCNHPMSFDQGVSCLVVKIAPLISNVLVLFLEQENGFSSSVTSPLATCNLSLSTSEGLLSFAVVFGRLDFLTFRGHQEGLQSQINASGRKLGRYNYRIRQLTRKDNMPAIGLSFEGNGLNLALQLTMPLDLEKTDMLDVEPIIFDLASITILGKLHCIKAVSSLETRVSRFLSCFQSSEEGLESTIKSSKRGLATGEVGSLQVLISQSFLFELSRLILIGDGTLFLFPCVFAISQGTVIQMTVCFNHRLQALDLFLVRINPILERLTHWGVAPFAALVGCVGILAQQDGALLQPCYRRPEQQLGAKVCASFSIFAFNDTIAPLPMHQQARGSAQW
jgi:hypothetical protein